MKKIIAEEVNPRDVDFSFYFDDDGLKSVGGKNCACYIIPGDRRYNTGFNMDEYKDIERRAEDLIDGFDDVSGGMEDASYEKVLEDLGIEYSDETKDKLIAWVKNGDYRDPIDIAELLSITTGEKWSVREFRGYCQGDYCVVVYCPAHYTEAHITEIGKLWLGCGTEFVIDDVGGYFVVDEIRWREGADLINLLAEYSGYKPEELEVHLYIGEHTVSDYKILIA